ncbi:MAG: signal peptidase II [Defluviitaleaceae bacterium]|nr:signal peptidase II [Defluviitaleaceae bacterium]
MKYFLIATAVFAADQFTKRLAERKLTDGREVKVGKLKLCNVRNSGAALGVLSEDPKLLAAFTATAVMDVLGIYYNLYKDGKFDGGYKLSLAYLLGGAAGNLFDRARKGYVTDFIQIGKGPVFNLADVFVLAGVGTYIARRLKGLKKKA